MLSFQHQCFTGDVLALHTCSVAEPLVLAGVPNLLIECHAQRPCTACADIDIIAGPFSVQEECLASP